MSIKLVAKDTSSILSAHFLRLKADSDAPDVQYGEEEERAAEGLEEATIGRKRLSLASEEVLKEVKREEEEGVVQKKRRISENDVRFLYEIANVDNLTDESYW